MASKDNWEKIAKSAIASLKKIADGKVPSDGPEHNAYYDNMEFAERRFKALSERVVRKLIAEGELKPL